MTAQPATLADGYAIVAENLSKSYRLYSNVTDQAIDVLGLRRMFFWRRIESRTFCALDGIDLAVRRGERVGIVGRNGAGKSTLLKLLAGVSHPSGGRLAVSGEVQALMHVGIGFHNEFTGIENVRAALLYSALDPEQQAEAEAEIIDFCELGEFIEQPLKTYSLGMRARLQFACATAIRPDILIVDEILGTGDVYFSAKSSERMRRLTGDGCALLLVSHSMQQVIQFCERVVWLDGGRVVQDGPARKVVSAYETFMFDMTKKVRMSNPAPGSIVSPADTDPSTRAIPDWYRRRLASLMSGQIQVEDQTFETEAARWVNDARLRIAAATVRDEDGQTATSFMRGATLSFRIEIEAMETGSYDCWFVVLTYGDDGRPLLRQVSEKQVLTMTAGERYIAEVHYERLLLGKGEYHASIGIFRHWDPDDRNSAHWYEILNRSVEFRVDYSGPYDPALLEHPAAWSYPKPSEG